MAKVRAKIRKPVAANSIPMPTMKMTSRLEGKIRMYIPFIEDDRVKVAYHSRDGNKLRVITSVADFDQFLADEAKQFCFKAEDLLVSIASTIDYAEDETSNPETIALAKALRARKSTLEGRYR